MATTYKTVQTYECDGTQRIFAFPFDYLRTSFIKCSLDAVEQVNGTAYSVPASLKQVEFPIAPIAGTILKIYRETTTDRLVTWADASVLRAKDLTVFEVQLLHVAEETKDAVQAGGMAVDSLDGKWQGSLRVIKDLMDPENPGDAVPLRYLESAKGAVITARDTAITKATEAVNSATLAKTSETNAKTSETNAQASEAAAKASETNSKASEVAARTSEVNSAGNATSASNSADAASRSEGNALLYMEAANNYAGYTKAEADSKFPLKTQEAWKTPTLLNGWINHGTGNGFTDVKYYKDSLGVVRLVGNVKNGTMLTAIFTLPVGYRPSAHMACIIISNGLIGSCTIRNDGQVIAQNGNNTAFSLDGISFRAEG